MIKTSCAFQLESFSLILSKITESKFMDIKNKLKDLKKTCTTKEEFKNKFEQYNFLDNIKKNKFIYNT